MDSDVQGGSSQGAQGPEEVRRSRCRSQGNADQVERGFVEPGRFLSAVDRKAVWSTEACLVLGAGFGAKKMVSSGAKENCRFDKNEKSLNLLFLAGEEFQKR